MGFWDKLFGGKQNTVSEDVKRARERHGIEVDEEQEEQGDKGNSGWEEAPEKYDPWEDIKDLRMNFWVGGWAARRLRWRPSNDKLRTELEELARKREEKAQKELAEAEARGDMKAVERLKKEAEKRAEKDRKALASVENTGQDKLRAELEEVERKRQEKQRQKEENKQAKGE